MDKLKRNITHPQKHKPINRLMKAVSTFGLSEVIHPESVEKRLDSIEEKGFQPDAVQKALDDLDRRAIAGSNTAALLRGAFNDLIDQNNTLSTQIEEKGE